MSPQHAPDLARFKFYASIDYVSLRGADKRSLPRLDGKAKWSRKAPGKLTIHDPSARDIGAMSEAFPDCFIEELEVCVDVRTARRLAPNEQDEALKSFKAAYAAKQLSPKFPRGMNSGFRGGFNPVGVSILRPFNHRVPEAQEQLLYGHRNDPIQVKCYYKKIDDRKSLPVASHRVRTEVRLGPVGLGHHGLVKVSDLIGFRFRKDLMGYFNHVCGSRLPRVREARRSELLSKMYAWADKHSRNSWEKTGVGMHIKGGKSYRFDLLYKRSTALNNRIGQALGRLEQSLRAKNFVRAPDAGHG